MSLKALGLSDEVITIFEIESAPEELQEVDVTGRGRFAYVIPDKLSTTVVIRKSLSHSVLSDGTVYIL